MFILLSYIITTSFAKSTFLLRIKRFLIINLCHALLNLQPGVINLKLLINSQRHLTILFDAKCLVKFLNFEPYDQKFLIFYIWLPFLDLSRPLVEEPMPYRGRILSQAGNELGTSKARGIRENHHETRSLLVSSTTKNTASWFSFWDISPTNF